MIDFYIPATAPEIDDELTGIGQLLTAKGWHAAALLATVVKLDNDGGDRRSQRAISARTSTDRLTPTQFAAKGIRGFRSKDTVRRYVELWHQYGEPEVPQFGDGVRFPVNENGEPLSFPPAQDDYNSSSTTIAQKIGEGKRGSLIGAISESPIAMHTLVQNAPDEVISQIASNPRVQVESVRQRRANRHIIDPSPDHHGLADGLADLLASNVIDQNLNQLVEFARRGMYDKLEPEVRTEAQTVFRKWRDTMEFLLAIVEGQSVTDQNIREWLDAV